MVVQDYVQALIAELDRCGRDFTEQGVRTVYIGGGTPSMLPPPLLARLLKALEQTIPQIREGECTLEANPGTLGPETLSVLEDSPVNRLSLGIQSTNDALLQRIGRIHTWREAQKAYEDARASGFENISVDLIYGLPGQNLADWERSLYRVASLMPDHVSAYGLQVEEGTVLATRVSAGDWQLPEEAEEAAMADATGEILAQQGLLHYEISSYCRPGRESRHNSIYWHNESYRGLGAGAFSYANRIRSSNVYDPQEYIRRVINDLPLTDWQEQVTEAAEMEETMMMTLRLTAGVSLAGFRERFGVDPRQAFSPVMEKLIKLGLLQLTQDNLAPTPLGMRFNNRIGREFIGSLT
jgi:oxygen-independent coproporphyrinogen-3 oxidase